MAKVEKVRFSITLDELTDARLVALGQGQRPPLSKQYLVEYAVERLLSAADSGQLRLPLQEFNA